MAASLRPLHGLLLAALVCLAVQPAECVPLRQRARRTGPVVLLETDEARAAGVPLTTLCGQRVCPVANGVCCSMNGTEQASGEGSPNSHYCCHEACAANGGCGPSATNVAIELARLKMEEEAQQDAMQESSEKARAAMEAKRKAAAEMVAKKKKEIEEAEEQQRKDDHENEKVRIAQSEEDTKATAAADRQSADEHATKEQERQKQRAADMAAAQEKIRTKGEEAAADKRQSEQDIKSLLIKKDPFVPQAGVKIAEPEFFNDTHMYTYMFWVQPQGSDTRSTCLFQKGSNNNERNPGVYFRAGTTELLVRSGTRQGWNQGLNAPRNLDLKVHVWTHVAITHQQGALVLYMNGAEVARTEIMEPLMNKGGLWSAPTWQTPAPATIADLRYMPTVASPSFIKSIYEERRVEEQKMSEFLVVKDNIMLTKGKMIATAAEIKSSMAFSYAFWIKLVGIPSTNALNLFFKGSSNRERGPAVYTQGNRLRIYSSTVNKWSDNVFPAEQLPLNEWTHVAFSHRDGSFVLYINGRRILQRDAKTPATNDGPLYASYGPPSASVLSDLRYFNGIIDAEKVVSIMQEKKYTEEPRPQELIVRRENFSPVRNFLLTPADQIPQAIPQYTYTFWIKPQQTSSGWTNVFRKGEKAGGIDNRGPAVFIYPATTRLHIRVATRRNGNDGVDPTQDLPLNQWTHVAITHMEGDMSVYYNAVKVKSDALPTPILNDDALYTARNSNPAPVILADLRYYNGILSNNDIKTVFGEQKYTP